MSTPKFSNGVAATPIRVDPDGTVVMPEWSDPDLPDQSPTKAKVTEPKEPREPGRRVARELQPDATQMDSVTQAKEWLAEHPEEAEMLRAAQTQTGDILADSGVPVRWYSSTEAAAFFDKTVQWLYWGMRHPPHGGRLFIEPVLDARGRPTLNPDGTTVMRDIPVYRLGDPKTGKRRFDIPTIRKFATSAYHQANIKEPKLTAVLQRLVVAERGGNWKIIPIPKRQEPEVDAVAEPE